MATHNHKAPLYWTVYEYVREMERQGIPYGEMDLTSDQWNAIIDMVSKKMLPYGYDMICTDGFIPQDARFGADYMSHYGTISLKTLAAMCKQKGLKLGVYDNPLWIKASLDKTVPGKDYTYRYLTRNSDDVVMYPDVIDRPDFGAWLVTDRPGAKDYIDGFFKHYKELGVEFIRMDFMCWYEDSDPGRTDKVTCGYGRERYKLGLQYICEAAEKYGIFTSIVMPELYYDAELESKYCNMTRIVQDTDVGGWHHFSDYNRGVTYDRWPHADNQMDAFTKWAHIGGRDKIILDGDFLRLNKCTSDAERQCQVSLQLMAGGPVAAADTPETMGDNIRFYTNEEMLALNADRFVGKPVSDEINSEDACKWWGRMSDGDYVIAIFNRELITTTYKFDLSQLGLNGEYRVRDLWSHAYEGTVTGSDQLKARLQRHSCKVVRLTPVDVARVEKLYLYGQASPSHSDIANAVEMTKVSDGEYRFDGILYRGELRFVGDRQLHSVNIMPATDGVELSGTTSAKAFNGNPFELATNWRVETPGQYEITVKVSATGSLASVTATRKGDLPLMMTILGGATGQWDNTVASEVRAAQGQTSKIEWTGVVGPRGDRRHFKFGEAPGYPYETTFFIPEEVDYNDNVKLVTLGNTYRYREVIGEEEDHFFGLAPSDCGKLQVSVNRQDKTVTFSRPGESGVENVNDGKQAVTARFDGDLLLVSGDSANDIEVFDLTGRLVAHGNGPAIDASALASGIYVVRCGSVSLKLRK